MTSVLVLDTSVMMKWFRQHEADADKALAIRDTYLAGKVVLIAPALALVEFANVLRYLNDLDGPDAFMAVDSLLDMGIIWLPVSRKQLKRTIEIARNHDTTVYDALFAAVAEEQDALYISAVKRFTDKAADLDCVYLLTDFRVEEVIG